MLNQKWLWNFPEGPFSPCCSPSDCQSLTSTAAAIGWRANRAARYWSASLCHTDQRVQALFFLSKSIFFCCNAEISPCMRQFIFTHIWLTFLECDSINEWIFKGAFREVILASAMHNRVPAIPTGFLVCLLKWVQMFRLNITSLW